MIVECRDCGARVRIPNDASGKSLRCPQCGVVRKAPPNARSENPSLEVPAAQKSAVLKPAGSSATPRKAARPAPRRDPPQTTAASSSTGIPKRLKILIGIGLLGAAVAMIGVGGGVVWLVLKGQGAPESVDTVVPLEVAQLAPPPSSQPTDGPADSPNAEVDLIAGTNKSDSDAAKDETRPNVSADKSGTGVSVQITKSEALPEASSPLAEPGEQPPVAANSAVAVNKLPEPAMPAPAMPAPAMPEPKTPEPATPERVLPEPARPETSPRGAGGQLPREMISRLKAATVFIIAGKGIDEATGSGFVVRVKERQLIIATNAHVVGGEKIVKCILNSGSNRETALEGKVLIRREETDLALVELAVNDAAVQLPETISLEQIPELYETLEVVVFGFPFGRLLAGDVTNPAPTVGRGFVSSLRTDKSGAIAAIQIDGALNPGNSGGPIMDLDGRLVGIATATVPGAQIGLAVPAANLKWLLKGQLEFVSAKIVRGTATSTEVLVAAKLADVVNEIAEVAIVFMAKPDDFDGVEANAETHSFELIGEAADEVTLMKERGDSHEGTLTLKGTEGTPVSFLMQPKITHTDGTVRYLSPTEVPVGFGKDRRLTSVEFGKPKENEATATNGDKKEKNWIGGLKEIPPDERRPGVRPKPRDDNRAIIEKDRSLLGPRFVADDVRFYPLLLPAREVIPNLCWSADGASIYVGLKAGLILRLSADDFKVQAVKDLQQPCEWIGVSKRGLCVAVDQQLIVLDSDDLHERSKVVVSGPFRFASAPASDLVVARRERPQSLIVVDLKADRVLHEYTASDLRQKFEKKLKKHPTGTNLGEFRFPTMTPDGKYLFCCGYDCLHRFDINGKALVYDQMGPRIGQNPQRIDVSPDSKYVAMPSGGGNSTGIAGHPQVGSYSTYIYSVNDLTDPVSFIPSGAYPRCLGFNPAAGLIYAQKSNSALMVFQPDGVLQREYTLSINGQNHPDPTQMLVHPKGKSLVMCCSNTLLLVEFTN